MTLQDHKCLCNAFVSPMKGAMRKRDMQYETAQCLKIDCVTLFLLSMPLWAADQQLQGVRVVLSRLVINVYQPADVCNFISSCRYRYPTNHLGAVQNSSLCFITSSYLQDTTLVFTPGTNKQVRLVAECSRQYLGNSWYIDLATCVFKDLRNNFFLGFLQYCVFNNTRRHSWYVK